MTESGKMLDGAPARKQKRSNEGLFAALWGKYGASYLRLSYTYPFGPSK